jgi:hypothetical protein
LTLRVDTSNIDVLDGRNLPDWQPDYFKDLLKLSERQPSSGGTGDPSPTILTADQAEPDNEVED